MDGRYEVWVVGEYRPDSSFSESFEVLEECLTNVCSGRLRKSSIVIAADDSTISWGPSPTFGELVCSL